MNKFIEVTTQEHSTAPIEKILLNVQDILKVTLINGERKCSIQIRFLAGHMRGFYSINTVESYEEVKKLILE